jgi:hypothetical protein
MFDPKDLIPKDVLLIEGLYIYVSSYLLIKDQHQWLRSKHKRSIQRRPRAASAMASFFPAQHLPNKKKHFIKAF